MFGVSRCFFLADGCWLVIQFALPAGNREKNRIAIPEKCGNSDNGSGMPVDSLAYSFAEL